MVRVVILNGQCRGYLQCSSTSVTPRLVLGFIWVAIRNSAGVWIYAYHFNPCPPTWIITTIMTLGGYNDDGNDNAYKAPPNYASRYWACCLMLSHIESPYGREKLAIDDYAQHHSMEAERKVINSYGWYRCRRMPISILWFDRWWEEKCCLRDGVAREANHVREGIIYGHASGWPSSVIENRLGIKRKWPAKKAICRLLPLAWTSM